MEKMFKLENCDLPHIDQIKIRSRSDQDQIKTHSLTHQLTYTFLALDINILKHNALIFTLSLKGVIGKILLKFSMRVCSACLNKFDIYLYLCVYELYS